MVLELAGRIKKVFADDWVTLVTVICVALLSFSIGRLSVLYSHVDELKITETPQSETAAAIIPITQGVTGTSQTNNSSQVVTSEIPTNAQFVASRKGTKYHLLNCSGAKTISDENKIYFSTKEEAEARGYMPAANCKGI